jgi:oxygen-dependent protoporphyrinogen oxidase
VVSPDVEAMWLQPAQGDAVPLPTEAVLGIPGTPLAADVIRVVGPGSALRAQFDSLIPALWWSTSLTLGELVRRRMGRGVLDKLVAPVVRSVYSLHPDDLSLDRIAGLRAALMVQGSLSAAVRTMRAALPASTAVQGIRGGVHRLVTELEVDLATYGVEITLDRHVGSLAGLPGQVVVAAPGIVTPLDGRRVVLVTLVVDESSLDAMPRDAGVLVASGTPSVMARSLTHSTAQWQWLRERSGGKHVLRLSYDSEPSDLPGQALTDASKLLGMELQHSSVVDFARVEWTRPAASIAPAEIVVVGETVGGSGIAGIVAHAEATAAELLAT